MGEIPPGTGRFPIAGRSAAWGAVACSLIAKFYEVERDEAARI